MWSPKLSSWINHVFNWRGYTGDIIIVTYCSQWNTVHLLLLEAPYISYIHRRRLHGARGPRSLSPIFGPQGSCIICAPNKRPELCVNHMNFSSRKLTWQQPELWTNSRQFYFVVIRRTVVVLREIQVSIHGYGHFFCRHRKEKVSAYSMKM